MTDQPVSLHSRADFLRRAGVAAIAVSGAGAVGARRTGSALAVTIASPLTVPERCGTNSVANVHAGSPKRLTRTLATC